jgi:hypothetical protein
MGEAEARLEEEVARLEEEVVRLEEKLQVVDHLAALVV